MMASPCAQIDDPLNPHNNVAKSSFKFYDIKVKHFQIIAIDCS